MKRYTQNPTNRGQRKDLLGRALLRKRKGDFLVEGTIALFVLVSLMLVMLQGSLTIVKPRAQTIGHNMADAYLSYELAYANRVDFDSISDSGEWPEYPLYQETQVNLGTLPNSGIVLTGDVRRTRSAYDWTPTGTGAISFTDLGIQVWKLQSHLVYTVNGDTFVKSRIVIRSQ
ncbi:hypothetical protein SAMN02745181_2445 [Rubritalea squalenifaciens DSM 18772]|uniref:Type II secretion system protein n=1 Tax=Rubritalea squalenifaciens DSM 18772 TaxID=1123071 RepID=A0A1M6LMM4_9BACT|nr:hypothetical protein [Rubritalea squalenifaciens]SHJ72469.1 hypothetical protein SAMN02745181_2445 [Rubritalea squalenifaciens DSM 18772]